MKIYTKTGDQGTSSLYNGERRDKTDIAFQALGDVDELNSLCGVAREFLVDVDAERSEQVTADLVSVEVQLYIENRFLTAHISIQLQQIQSRLLDVGSVVATPLDKSTERKLQRVVFDSAATSCLEAWIDSMDETLPPLTNFILPSGGKAASFLHLARAVCRRAERSVASLVQDGAADAVVAVYLNRLSDYLFTAARIASRKANQPETIYRKA